MESAFRGGGGGGERYYAPTKLGAQAEKIQKKISKNLPESNN